MEEGRREEGGGGEEGGGEEGRGGEEEEHMLKYCSVSQSNCRKEKYYVTPRSKRC